MQKTWPYAGQVSTALNSAQTLAAFGAACIDHGTTTTGFHANEKAVCACAADFGWLICTFHGELPRKDMKIAHRSVCDTPHGVP